MSKLQSVAGNLRALANDSSPLSTNVGSSARQLTVIGKEAESLSRNGVNLNRLLSAIQVAQKAAESAASAAAQVKSDGVAWADHLARGGGGSHTSGSAQNSSDAVATRSAAYADLAIKVLRALPATVLPFAAGKVVDHFLPGSEEPIEKIFDVSIETQLV